MLVDEAAQSRVPATLSVLGENIFEPEPGT